MAYMLYLASVTRSEVEACHLDRNAEISPFAFGKCSYALRNFHEPPLAEIVRDAIDGGEPLSSSFRHRKRSPRWHTEDAVVAISRRFENCYQALIEMREEDGSWIAVEISTISSLFCDAASKKACVITALDLGDVPNWKINLGEKGAGKSMDKE